MLKQVMIGVLITFGLGGCNAATTNALNAVQIEPASPAPDDQGIVSTLVNKEIAAKVTAGKLLTGNPLTRYTSVDIPEGALAAPTEISIFETGSLLLQIVTDAFGATLSDAGPAIVVLGDSTALTAPITVNIPYDKDLSLAQRHLAVLVIHDSVAELIVGSKLISNADNTLGVQTMFFGAFQVVNYTGDVVAFTTSVTPVEFKSAIEMETEEVTSSRSTDTDTTTTTTTDAPSAAAQEEEEEEQPAAVFNTFVNSLLTCEGSGKVRTIADEYIDDWGSSDGGDSLEIYCQDGKSRFCLSGEACTWRSGVRSSDTTTCSSAGLGGSQMAEVRRWQGVDFNVNCSRGIVRLDFVPAEIEVTENYSIFRTWIGDCIDSKRQVFRIEEDGTAAKGTVNYVDDSCSMDIDQTYAEGRVSISTSSNGTALLDFETTAGATIYDIYQISNERLCLGTVDATHTGLDISSRPIQINTEACYQ